MTIQSNKYSDIIHDLVQIALSKESNIQTVSQVKKILSNILFQHYKKNSDRDYQAFSYIPSDGHARIIYHNLLDAVSNKDQEEKITRNAITITLDFLSEQVSLLTTEHCQKDNITDILRIITSNFIYNNESIKEEYIEDYICLISSDTIYRKPQSSDDTKICQLEYIDLFNEQIFSLIRFLLDHNHDYDPFLKKIFKSFYSLLNFFNADYFIEEWYNSISRLERLIDDILYDHSIEKSTFKHSQDLFRIRNGIFKITSIENIEAFFIEIKALSIDKIKNLAIENIEKVDIALLTIKALIIDYYKNQKVISLFFSIGGYCFYRHKYQLIDYLWHGFRRTNPNLCNPATLVPQNFRELKDKLNCFINAYFGNSYTNYSNRFESPHDVNLAYSEYLIYLLCDIVNDYNSKIAYDLNLSNIALNKLIEFKADDLLKAISLIKQSPENYKFKELGIRKVNIERFEINKSNIDMETVDNTSEVFQKNLEVISDTALESNLLEGIEEFLSELKIEAKTSLRNSLKNTAPDEALTNEFKKQYIASFDESVQMKHIFRKNFISYTDDKFLNLNNDFIDKGWLLKDYPMKFEGAGNHFGKQAARDEDMFFFTKLFVESPILDITDSYQNEIFSSFILDQMKFHNINLDGAVVIIDRSISYPEMKKVTDKDPNFYLDNPLSQPNQMDLEEIKFKHYYFIKDHEKNILLPIFTPNLNLRFNKLFVIDLNKIQVNIDRIQPLEIEIKEIDEIYIQKFLENQPQWFQERYSDPDRKMKFLEEMVILKVKEKINIILDTTNPIGLSFNLTKLNTSEM